MKFCNKCNTNRELSNFSKGVRNKDGLSNWCKDCNKEYLKSYYMRNKETLDEKNKEYYYKNIEHIKIKAKDYKEKNKEYYSEYFKDYYLENKDVLNEYRRSHYENNKEEYLERSKGQRKSDPLRYREYLKDWREKNQEYSKEYIKEWRLLNPDKGKLYWSILRDSKPHYIAWRSSLKSALRRMNRKKNNHTIDLLGYTPQDLKNHLENLFKEGMTWENWGEWHIDHIIPISKFNNNTPINVVNALSNLQPLWAFENLSKSNKI